MLKTQKAYLYDMWWVSYNCLMDELNPLQGLLEPRLGLGEIGLHRQSSLLKQVLEPHLLLITKDELSLPQVTRVGPHQLTGCPQPTGRSNQ